MEILSIALKTMFDDSPDLSYLGKYSNKYERGAINREAIGDMGRNEYKYFIPANDHYRFEDYKRYEAYNNNRWCCVGITAFASCITKLGNRNIAFEELSSGLWGIESDAGDYLDEIKQEQLMELRYNLSELGFGMIELDKAFENIEEKEY